MQLKRQQNNIIKIQEYQFELYTFLQNYAIFYKIFYKNNELPTQV